MTQARKFAVVLALFAAALTGRVDAQRMQNPYGVVEGFWFPEVTCELNVGWERIIFDWAQHQPGGPEDWHTLNVDDRWLKAANRCNREVVALLKNTPSWATSGMVGIGVPDGLYLPVDDPQNHWANFVRQTANYYAPRGVHRFIIWNEPDISPDTYGYEFEGTLEDYARMVQVAYLAAKQGNPAARVHLAGTTYWHNINDGERLYLDALLEHLSELPEAETHESYFHAISLHIYFRTDTVYEIVQESRGLLRRYGLEDKEIWVNETNAPPTQDPEWPVDRPVFQYTLAQQAAFMVQAAALGQAAGVERMAAYKLYDQELPPGAETFGILRPGTREKRPAYYAWQTAATLFGAAVGAERIQTERADAVLMARRDSSQVLAAWSRTADNAQITVSGVDGMRYTYLSGPEAVEPFEDAITVTLPGANCNGDDPAVPCTVGGEVVILLIDSLEQPTISGSLSY